MAVLVTPILPDAPDGLLHRDIWEDVLWKCLEKGSHLKNGSSLDWMNHLPNTVYHTLTSSNQLNEM